MIAAAVPRTPGRAAVRLAIGFTIGVAIWIPLSPVYEKGLAASGETLERLTEFPPVTRLEARRGEILVERADFPPAAPRPGLPAADLHFNFVLLVALFAMAAKPWRGEWLGRFAMAALLLCAVHTIALMFQVRSIYAVQLGGWSAVHYGAGTRNFWAGGFHFYQIVGRFAAPLAIWWLFARLDRTERSQEGRRPRARRRTETPLRIVR